MTENTAKLAAFANARQMDRVQDLLTRSINRLSSGSRVINASDDPQGVGLIGKITAQSRRIQAAVTNVQNATSYLQSADGFASSMSTVVTRMSELSVLAKDVMKNGGDIALYQTEFAQLQEQLRTTIGGTTAQIGGTTGITKPLGMFNGNVLFGTNPTGTPVAAGDGAADTITIPETNLRQGSILSLIQQDASGNYTMSVTSGSALSTTNGANQQLTDLRSLLGAVTRRFEVASDNLTRKDQNLTSSLSDIRDADIAGETTRMAKYQMLSQSGAAMSAQANSAPRSILQLLQSR